MVRAKVIRNGRSDEGFEFLGLWKDDMGDAQVVLRDLTVKGLMNIVILHPSKVLLEDSKDA